MPTLLAALALCLALPAAVQAPRANPLRGVCHDALRAWDPAGRQRASYPERLDTCARLAELAEEAGPHAPLTLAVALEESHWSPADQEGAVRGACQVAACHCPGGTFRGCDLEAACAATVARLLSEENGSARVALRRWLAGYRRGRQGPLDAKRERWIGAVIAGARELEAELAGARAPVREQTAGEE